MATIASWSRNVSWDDKLVLHAQDMQNILVPAMRNPAAGVGLFKRLAALPNVPIRPLSLKQLIRSALSSQELLEAAARRPDYGREALTALSAEADPRGGNNLDLGASHLHGGPKDRCLAWQCCIHYRTLSGRSGVLDVLKKCSGMWSAKIRPTK